MEARGVTYNPVKYELAVDGPDNSATGKFPGHRDEK